MPSEHRMHCFVGKYTEEIVEAASNAVTLSTSDAVKIFVAICPIRSDWTHPPYVAGLLADEVNDCLIYNQLFCPSSDRLSVPIPASQLAVQC